MDGLSVGEVAALLGVAPSTVRMWGTRYGVTASARSAGGHRRYTADDLARLRSMQADVLAGADPAAAAAAATGAEPTARPPGSRGGPGGSVLAVPGAGREVRGLARAASRLDAMTVEDTVVESLERDGTVRTWDHLVRPVLTAAGAYWQSTGAGIEIEHLLSEALISAFDRYRGALPGLPMERPVLLAGGPQEEHVLPLHALRSALAEGGVPARLLGPRTPITALAAAARRIRAAAVVCWASRSDREAARDIGLAVTAHRHIRVFVAGPGWNAVDVPGVQLCATLTQSVQNLTACWLQPKAPKT